MISIAAATGTIFTSAVLPNTRIFRRLGHYSLRGQMTLRLVARALSLPTHETAAHHDKICRLGDEKLMVGQWAHAHDWAC